MGKDAFVYMVLEAVETVADCSTHCICSTEGEPSAVRTPVVVFRIRLNLVSVGLKAHFASDGVARQSNLFVCEYLHRSSTITPIRETEETVVKYGSSLRTFFFGGLRKNVNYCWTPPAMKTALGAAQKPNYFRQECLKQVPVLVMATS
ncbi:unnamed protein product [Allacma fusca]|uniref:Uncharacterized protein n=1 Tax=Allacma fusca TaxID=39272 RepID=A0A8J2KCG9_9HEXA|nr:unnamed protein product [Allacma fusca]